MATLEERIAKIDDYRKRKSEGKLTLGERLVASTRKQEKKQRDMYSKYAKMR